MLGEDARYVSDESSPNKIAATEVTGRFLPDDSYTQN